MPKATIFRKISLICALISFYCTLPEARRITRNELTKLLSQNGGVGGFGQTKFGYKQELAPRQQENYTGNVNDAAQRMSKQKGVQLFLKKLCLIHVI